MASIISDLSSDFIGIVKGYTDPNNPINIIKDEKNIKSRTLEVYIPKLMPNIDERAQLKTLKTNCGNPNIRIKHNAAITIGSSISVPAKDVDIKLPKIGSLVKCKFFDGDWYLRYWRKFNPLGTWEVIDSEKYPKLYDLRVSKTDDLQNDFDFEINTDDKFCVDLNGFVVKKDLNYKGKEKHILISIDKKVIENMIDEMIVKRVGQTESSINRIVNGEDTLVYSPSTGIYSKLDLLLKNINTLTERVNTLENSIVSETNESSEPTEENENIEI